MTPTTGHVDLLVVSQSMFYLTSLHTKVIWDTHKTHTHTHKCSSVGRQSINVLLYVCWHQGDIRQQQQEKHTHKIVHLLVVLYVKWHCTEMRSPRLVSDQCLLLVSLPTWLTFRLCDRVILVLLDNERHYWLTLKVTCFRACSIVVSRACARVCDLFSRRCFDFRIVM